MSQTTNYALDKYDAGDVPNLLDQYNSSMDTIDLQLKSQSDRITTLEAGSGSGSGTTVSAGTGVSVSGSSSAGYTVSLNEASASTIGGVCVADEVDPSAPLPHGDPYVPTVDAVKAYVDSHSGGGSGDVTVAGTNGVSVNPTSIGDGIKYTVSGVNASTSQVGVVRLTSNVGDNSSNVPTAAAVKSYVDSHSGGGGIGAVNATNGVTGSVSGSTLNISGVNATATQPGVVEKVSNMTGGSTDAVPTCSAVIDYVAGQIGTGGGGIKTASGTNGVNASVSGTALTVTGVNASTSAKGVVQLASSGSSTSMAATPSYVNSVAESITNATQQIHQSLSASGSNVQTANGDVFILPRLGIGIAMLYLQTSTTLSAGAQVKYNYTVPAAYRPPQQAQALRLYNHLTGSGLLGQVRTDGSVYISVEGGTGVDFVGAVTVVWGFQPL